MQTIEKVQALRQLTGSRGWQDMVLPEVEDRFAKCQEAWMHTSSQTSENLHKTAGMASVYHWLLTGIPDWVAMLERQLEEENRTAQGDPEQRPPV